ncbi:GNAT family N-acetyltransferase [Cellulomonas sp. S1-8]|uniref:GNAT family N-acetyltransferase n=1 Tax=Cellulomonas sp. S1-8 TaxID=2904790 RepID=UPI00224397AC|nr:GNAT family N-acetyltransferase [Cellulomonas sp. S1-8]UZN05148.1 GNAT family N-acetyltransferase [Cellulomonas sp. S1-8]
MSEELLARLPAALRTRRDVLDCRDRWAGARVLAATTAAVVLVGDRPAGPEAWAIGDEHDLARLVADALTGYGPGLRWATVPRAVTVPDDALAAAGLVPATRWDRLSSDVPPARQPGEEVVVGLDALGDRAAIDVCLDVANPTTHARPGAPDDAAWWGVRDAADHLLGVIGVAMRPGTHAPVMHLHGLGVVPAARGRGLGAALAATATRRALADGAPWVSLGMYADNVPARRVYSALGFRVDVENAGYGPPGATRP